MKFIGKHLTLSNIKHLHIREAEIDKYMPHELVQIHHGQLICDAKCLYHYRSSKNSFLLVGA